MPSLLVVVFTIHLVIYLINAISAKTINNLLWTLYNKLPTRTSADYADQVRLRRDVVQLKREMAGVSAQDNFSQWAKLRRQHDKAMDEHDRKASAVSATRSSFDVTANTTRWVATNGVRLLLQFWHAKTPLFSYPRGWVPWQVEWVLGFPRAPYGTVSIQVWGAACASVIELVGELVTYVMKMTMTMTMSTKPQSQSQNQNQGARRKEEPMKFGAGSAEKKSR